VSYETPNTPASGFPCLYFIIIGARLAVFTPTVWPAHGLLVIGLLRVGLLRWLVWMLDQAQGYVLQVNETVSIL